MTQEAATAGDQHWLDQRRQAKGRLQAKGREDWLSGVGFREEKKKRKEAGPEVRRGGGGKEERSWIFFVRKWVLLSALSLERRGREGREIRERN